MLKDEKEQLESTLKTERAFKVRFQEQNQLLVQKIENLTKQLQKLSNDRSTLESRLNKLSSQIDRS